MKNKHWHINEQIIKSLPIPMVVFNRSFDVLVLNKAFKDLFSRYQKNIRRGINLSEVFERNIDLFERIENSINSSQDDQFVYIIEEEFFSVNITVVEEAGDSTYILMFNNVTEQEQEEAIRRKFISIVAHELRTPLAAVSSHAELIAYHEKMTKEEMRETAQIIYIEAQRLSKMVTELLDISRYNQMQIKLDKTDFNLTLLLDDLIQLYKTKDARNDVTVTFQTLDLEIYADYDKLKQVLINLIENAYVYTKDKVEISAQTKNNKLRISVVDNGIGLTIKQKANVFHRFYRTDESRNRNSGGTGLGLSIVKEIVELHNGTIFVQSEKNIGSEFIVEIPIKEI